MRTVLVSICMVLVSVLPSFSKDKTLGYVADAAVLGKVNSYCLDTTKEAPRDLIEVQKFAAEEANPKKSLGKLTWTKVDDCTQADAVLAFSFEETTKVAQAGNSVAVQVDNNVPVEAFAATLIITSRSSGKLIYKVTGEATESAGYRSMVNAVQKLAKDLKKLPA